MRRRRLTRTTAAAAAALLALLAAPAATAEDYALLVGASGYEKVAGLKDLKFARDDVVEFAASLRRSGYKPGNVVLMHDGLADAALVPTGVNIVRQLELLLNRLQPSDSVVVALAGHGVQFRGEKVNYFCPIDTALDRRDTMVPLPDIYTRLEECPAGHKLLLVDACRNDPQASRSRALTKVKLESVTRPQADPIPRSIAAVFSCRADQESYEDDKIRHGLFFANVLKAWDGQADGDPDRNVPPDGKVTLGEFCAFVQRQTSELAARRLGKSQVPVARNEEGADWVLRALPGRSGPAAAAVAEGQALLRARDYARARAAYARALASDPGSARARHGRGLAALALGDTAAAVADLREAVRLDPDDGQAWISLGGALGRSGRHDEALKAYGRAIQLDGLAAAAYVGRGAARLQLGQLDAALGDLNQALRLQADHRDALFYRAAVHDRRGDPAAARADRDRLQAVGRPTP